MAMLEKPGEGPENQKPTPVVKPKTEAPKEGFTQPKPGKPREVLPDELEKQLAILKNPSLTEQQKIDALQRIAGLFLDKDQQQSITKNDVTDTLSSIKEVISNSADVNARVVRFAFITMSCVFHIPAEKQDAAGVRTAIDTIALILMDKEANSGTITQAAFSLAHIFVSTQTLENTRFALDLLADFAKMYPHISDNSESNAIYGGLDLILSGLKILFKNGELSQSFLLYLNDIRKNPDTDPSLNDRIARLLMYFCFLKPDLLGIGEFSHMLNLDPQTARDMLAASPDWYTYDSNYDFSEIYSLAQSHPNEPIVKTLFEQNNVTYFGLHDADFWISQYENLNKLTGNPLWFVVTTKKEGGVNFGEYMTQELAQKFDIRYVEAGTDEKMEELLEKTAQRLGVKPKDEDPAGQKFKLFSVNGHGNPSVIVLSKAFLHQPTSEEVRTSPMKGGADKNNAWHQMAPQDNPDRLDLTDGIILRNMARYLADDAVGFTEACNNASTDVQAFNLTDTIAETMKIRMFGAPLPAGPDPALYFSGTELVNVMYALVENGSGVSAGSGRDSYDYRHPQNFNLLAFDSKRYQFEIELNFEVPNKPTTEKYAIQRSAGGTDFETIGFIDVKPGENGKYTFSDTGFEQGKNVFYRIKQMNAVSVGPLSKDYTMAYSDVKEIDQQVQADERLTKYVLDQNYPNPFNASTVIRYEVPRMEHVSLKVYDVLGREVATLVDKAREEPRTTHEAVFDASNLASGTYFYTLQAGDHLVTKKMLVVK